MHAYALKSLCLSLKLGRIFQELYNDITSLTHSAPLQVRPQLSQQQDTVKYVSKSLGTQSHKILRTHGFLIEKVICTNKSIICILRNLSIKSTKGQWI